ncbi:SMI1/KNR4 family protein [Actinosynnema pretiosum subsp. pretiosum]|nr:SMI1/KNR4 family protein [Actinosynnema mirum]QUF03732.1 SMI1/KNR4 family protein [Actinosynnema pretiosum subsp. pretiosum]
MLPDMTLLRQLVDSAPSIRPWSTPAPEGLLRSVELSAGTALPRSYRWWLAEFGGGVVDGTPLGTQEFDADGLVFWRDGDCGAAYRFGDEVGGERCVVGDEGVVAESFAGFLTTRVALALGLRDGPNPAVARLWRATPGVLLDNGVHVYGPDSFGERNATVEVARYAPHWVLVGDDSGGAGLFMRRHGRDRESVHRLDLGAVGPDVAEDGELVTADLVGWVEAGGEL